MNGSQRVAIEFGKENTENAAFWSFASTLSL